MKLLRITALMTLSILPSLASALTVEELVASLSEDQLEKFQSIDASRYDFIADLLAPALSLDNEEDQFFIVDEVMLLFAHYGEQTMQNVFDEFEHAGIELTAEEKVEIENLVAEENLNFARQILETGASIEEINAEIARLRQSNQAMREALAELNRQLAESRAERDRVLQESTRILKLISETDRGIQQLENW